MKGPGFEFGAEEVDSKGIETRRRTLRNQTISKVRHLFHDRGITDFRKNADDPEVSDFYKIYGEYASVINEIIDPEQKFLVLLDEHMLPFDADMVNGEAELNQLSLELENEYLAKARDDNFVELEQKVLEYQKKIDERLKRVK